MANEWAVLSWQARGEFAGPWEIRDGLCALAPLSWLVIAPLALAFGCILALTRTGTRAARLWVALSAAIFAGAVGFGVTGGRHFEVWALRLVFVAALAGAAFWLAYLLGPRLGRALQGRAERCALVAVLAAVALEAVNRTVLPRLYPAFHLGLTALTVMAGCVIARGVGLLDGSGARAWNRLRWATALAVACLLASAVRSPSLAKRLMLSDNLRLVFLDRAPLLALGVELVARLAPPAAVVPVDDDMTADQTVDRRLAVDFRGRDLLLISVDALRADHVGAYGYSRPTTPHLDSLAREGALFARAYCPTPHTSYSVSSMMTGKPLRPLLAQGQGADSDTLAGLLRTYGYRTAAFYPPAIFYVDPELFASFRTRKLDFEFARIEFASAHERALSVASYLTSEPPAQRLFLWVHLFEPHEPYVAHAEHPFGGRDIDRYDAEIAAADDGIGEIVDAFRAVRPNAVIIVTADHGEEFGEHQGRYHGTTVYEEQVRVPLVIVAPGVSPGTRVEAPVQTVDIMPTVLSALDIPRPPRIRGNDIGHWLRGAPASVRSDDPARRGSISAGTRAEEEDRPTPPAYSESEEQVLLAAGPWRLVCTRRAAACALYNVDSDPGESRDLSSVDGARFAKMKAALRQVEASHGRYEATARTGPIEQRPWPEPIRRGLAGDPDAALEIALLLEDADTQFRRKAAELLFDLQRRETEPQLGLALSRDEDMVVRRFAAVALTRLGERVPDTFELLEHGEEPWRRLAALALAESGDARGADVLVAWWQSEVPPFSRARELLAALARIRAGEAVPALVRSLDDVRLRPYIAETLAAIGHPSARAPLAERFATERYQNSRVALGDALVRLGAKGELVGPLIRFLGTPDPLPGGLDLAARAGILARTGGASIEPLGRLRGVESQPVLLRFAVPAGGNGSGRRVVVRAHRGEVGAGQLRIGAPLYMGGDRVEFDAGHLVTIEVTEREATEQVATLPADIDSGSSSLDLAVAASSGMTVVAIAVVPLSDDLPPPPPELWQPSTEGPPRN